MLAQNGYDHRLGHSTLQESQSLPRLIAMQRRVLAETMIKAVLGMTEEQLRELTLNLNIITVTFIIKKCSRNVNVAMYLNE